MLSFARVGDTEEALRAELAATQAELEQSRKLLATTLDGFVLADSQGRIVDVNPSYCALLGYQREELLALNIRDVEATLTEGQIQARIAEMTAAGRARFETRHRRKNGAMVDLDVSVCTTGTPERPLVAAFVRDVTEHRQATAELMRSSTLLARVQELAKLGIWRWDIASNQVTWSTELYRIYGLDPNEFGASFQAYLERVHPADRDRVQRTVMAAVESKKPFSFSERVVRPNGDERCLRSWGGVVLNDSKQPTALFGVCLDVTEQERAQAALKDAHDALEVRVQQRTAELAEAKERAEAADRIKSAFLAAMSHELRTPLNSIIGFTGILLQGLVGSLNPEQQKQLGMVQSSARHLLSLINDVLDLSKIEAGELELNSGPIDLHKVISECQEIAAPLAEQKSLPLEVHVSADLGAATGDARRLRQILLNLLSNAIKFTEVGHVRVTARGSGTILHLSVEDTGIGIREEDLDTLFTPFRQLDAGLSRRHDGTGLGLAICHRLAKMMNGELRVHSRFGEGSTFEVLVPLLQEPHG